MGSIKYIIKINNTYSFSFFNGTTRKIFKCLMFL